MRMPVGLPGFFTRSANLASSPIDTNAKANQRVRNAFKKPDTCLVVSAGIRNEKRSEATIKPTTNFGNRSQMTARVGFVSAATADGCFFVYVQ